MAETGRPLKFQTVEELQAKMNAYFESCWTDVPDHFDEKGKLIRKAYRYQSRPYTISGLALFLETNRQTLINYEERPEFIDAIKAAKAKCENYVEELLLTTSHATGPIFNLKNNYGWKDQQQVEHSGDLPFSLTIVQKDAGEAR